MKIIIIVLIILLILALFPIPLKTIIYYSKENYYIKLFNFYILRKNFNTEPAPNEDAKPPKEKKSKKAKKKNKIPLKDIPIIETIKEISHNKFKPILLINGHIYYSLKDSAYTAISYGIFNTLIVFIYKLINIPFNSKRFKFNIIPEFKEKLFYEIKIKCILIFNIAQIIYILFIIFKIFIDRKVREYE